MAVAALCARLRDEIQDPEEETAVLFSQSIPAGNLGFIDPRAATLELTLSSLPSRPLTIHQSPSLLTSNLPGGTTGAVVWKVTPAFADFVAAPTNIFFSTGVLDASSTVLELGAGVSGVVALALGAKVGRYVVTDQEYVMRLLRANIAENTPSASNTGGAPGKRSKPRPSKKQAADSNIVTGNISALTLDWECDSVAGLAPQLAQSGASSTMPGFDAIVACDCIYNYALIAPLVETCAEACALRRDTEEQPTVCVVAQQLRAPEVFEAWLKAFRKQFRCWQVPDEMLPAGLREGMGFVVHVGVLR